MNGGRARDMDMSGQTKMILASASPRRRELLAQIGLEFEVQVSNVEEKAAAHSPGELVEELSRQKAEAVFALTDPAQAVLVIGADTVVALGEEILGKPADEAEAVSMLCRLSGASHQVYTGVTLLYREAGGKTAPAPVKQKTFHETTRVQFYPMSRQEIESYAATGEPLDKAGAYGIQGVFARYVQGLEGDYYNVVGLPVGRLYQELKDFVNFGGLCEKSGNL